MDYNFYKKMAVPVLSGCETQMMAMSDWNKIQVLKFIWQDPILHPPSQ